MDKTKFKISLSISVLVLVIQIMYSYLFGRENMIIGTIIGLATANFFKKDFTSNILYNTYIFIILNLILGIMSFVASSNVYFGFIINLITIFSVTYLYINDFRTPTSYIFIMGYIFIWASKITLIQLPKRLIAMTLAVVIIMFIQHVFNKDILIKKSKIVFIDIIKTIKKDIDRILNNTYKKDNKINNSNKVRKVMILLNERIHKRFYSPIENKIIFNIVTSLERISLIVDELYLSGFKDQSYYNDLKDILSNIEEIIKNEKSYKQLSVPLCDFILKYECLNIDELNQCIDLIKIINHDLEKLTLLDKKELMKVNKNYKIPKEFRKTTRVKQNMNLKSLLFVYSLKLSLSISIAMFIVDYYKIPYGKWIVTTIYVLLQPYLEDTKVKSKNRLKGTMIGVIIFLCINDIVVQNNLKLLVLFVSFIFYFYSDEYYKKVMSMTIIGLTSVSLDENINIVTIERLIFVLIGILVVMLFNRYIFPYSIKDSVKDLKDKQERLIKLIKNEINKDECKCQDKIIKIILICSEVEEKLSVNNNKIKDKNLELFITKQKIMIRDLRYLILRKYFYYNNDVLDKNRNKHIIDKLTEKVNDDIR